jgi:hypothetical protein
LNSAGFSQSRFKTRPACRFSGITPAEPGSAHAKLARRARNVKNFHRLIHHGIVKNSEVQAFQPIPVYNASESAPCWFFTIPLQNAPGMPLQRHHPGEAGVGASEACAPGAKREKLPPLNLSQDSEKFSVLFLQPIPVCNASESAPC